jgi:uncharacterized protein
MRKIKVIFDCNTWISFTMDGRLKKLAEFLILPELEIYACRQLFEEFQDVAKRPKLQKYLKPHLVDLARQALEGIILPFSNIDRPSISRDPKDDYFLYFAAEYNLDFIVTGDKDLLVLRSHGNTRICTFAEFVAELEKQATM